MTFRFRSARMSRKYLPPIVALSLLLVVAAAWWLVRSPSAAGRSAGTAANTGPGHPAAVDVSRQVAARLDEALVRLGASKDPGANRLMLADLRRILNSLPPEMVSREVQSFLASARDAATRLEITVESGGGLGDASSLRVFLLDYLGRIDRPAAGAVAAQILAQYTTPDEWAVSLRNFAWANPGAGSEAFLQAKARQLLGNPAWVREPSTGFLEAFDTIVYARGTALLPELAAFVRDRENQAAAHAAYLTLDRLTIAEPTRMLPQLVDQPDLMKGREQSRASLLARADLREPAQRAAVEKYLLDPARDAGELATFAGLYPNANYMVSNNLLTAVDTPKSGQLAAHDRAALAVVDQWLADPRFERLQPLLARIHERLATFVRQAANGTP